MPTLLGRLDWGQTRDKDGHRDYSIEWLVQVDDSFNDGPAMALACPGLPAIGATWAFGNDVDSDAYCWPNWSAKPAMSKEKGLYWVIGQTFSTKPLKRCQDDSITNPLAEPARIGGGFTKFTKEVTQDRHGAVACNSAWELFRGPIVEFDDNRPNVSIGLNIATLPLATIAQMVDTVNDAMLWGMEPRCVKLSNVRWQRQLYGTCTYYYSVDYEFDINFDTFDHFPVDEGTKVLAPGGDPAKPEDFVVYKDRNDENTRVLLDGNGAPLADGAAPHELQLEHYEESNFLTLGIPTTL